MPGSSPGRRPPMAVAMEWVSRITTISLTMALPALAGSWADSRWNLSPWMTVVGAFFGFAAAMTQLLQLARGSRSKRPDDRSLS